MLDSDLLLITFCRNCLMLESLLVCDDRLFDVALSRRTLFLFSFSLQITINTTNAQPLGQQLVSFTSKAAHFTDVMDVIFVTHLVERLTRLVEKRRDVRVNTKRYSTVCICYIIACDSFWISAVGYNIICVFCSFAYILVDLTIKIMLN